MVVSFVFKTLLPIYCYKDLLKRFYEDHIKNDRTERYLLKNTSCPAEYKGDRAIESAWQLYHYLSEDKERGRTNPSNIIRQGILLVFDARSEDTNITEPEQLLEIVNLDLDNCLKLQSKPFSASSASKHYTWN